MSMRADQLFDLTGRVAIVTGASSGLGARFAEVLHANGAQVVLAARRLDRLEALQRELPGSIAVACDLTQSHDRSALVEHALTRFGRVDILVNNAGMSGPATPAEQLTAQRWDTTVAVNLTGLFALTQLASADMLQRQRGSIINVGSVFGLVGNSPVMDAAYAATKGALVNLTRELGAEWARKGVRVNSIAPGWFPTEMTAGMESDERSQQYIARNCPMQRMGHIGELDGLLLFLASDASSYCTGQTIAVDGGWTVL